jgi:hypothetical protein
MRVPLQMIIENFIDTGCRWSSGHLFIGKIFSPSPNLPYSKEDLGFLYRGVVVDISLAIRGIERNIKVLGAKTFRE